MERLQARNTKLQLSGDLAFQVLRESSVRLWKIYAAAAGSLLWGSAPVTDTHGIPKSWSQSCCSCWVSVSTLRVSKVDPLSVKPETWTKAKVQKKSRPCFSGMQDAERAHLAPSIVKPGEPRASILRCHVSESPR